LRRLVQELPGIGTIQPPNPSRLSHGRVKVSEVNAHPASGATDGLPVRDTTAVSASAEPKILVAPRVTGHRTPAGNDFHLASIVVPPEATVATTDRTVAAGEAPWLAWDLDMHCPTVT